MPRPIVAMAKRYQKDALRIETIGEREAHADIAYQAVAVSPTDIEHVVVNLLRLHEAETAILFCATREAVRRLHASLTERGFQAVALSGEHSQNERNSALQSLRDRRARVCVATDVAARGLDLPSVSLVIHVELPRDAEALQHRSGRTGRAGRKGIAVLIVPFRRRRVVESMLRNARIDAEWIDAPTPEHIRAKDRERLLETLSVPVEADEDDRALAQELISQLSPEAIASALVRSLRTDLPAPEDILASGGREERSEGPRAGFEGSTWFRINAGRRHNADPRWLLPLICRYGHVSRNDIGAIRIAANESYFEVTQRATPGFIKALRRAVIAPEDEGLVIEPAPPRAVPAASKSSRPPMVHARAKPKRRTSRSAR
jgi:ATP-dependent RNA helicase DeaD